MATKLNRNFPYGAISGDTQGRCYEQDHQFFRGDGSLWVEPVPEVVADTAPAVPAAAKKGKAAAAAAVDALPLDSQLKAQLSGA